MLARPRTDRAIRMMDRLASCFDDLRCPELIEHQVVTLVGQRVFGIALGYEDLNARDELRLDPMLAVLSGKLAARREDCAPVAGKSTLNRLEPSSPGADALAATISHNSMAIKRLVPSTRSWQAQERAANEIILDLDATDDPVHGEQEAVHPRLLRLLVLLPLYVFFGAIAGRSSVAAPRPRRREHAQYNRPILCRLAVSMVGPPKTDCS